MRYTRLFAAIASLAWASGAVVLCSNNGALGQSVTTPTLAQPAGVVTQFQGWRDTVQWWHHVSQGTVFMPYEWFIALEQPAGEELFRAADNLAKLGFLPDPPNWSGDSHGLPINPDGLPVGFSRRQVDLGQPPYTCWKGKPWVGLTCAACHTGQVNYRGHQIRIEGGAAHHDLLTFHKQLGSALKATLLSGPKFDRFAHRIADRLPQTERDALQENLQCYLGFLDDGERFLDSAGSTLAGPGRLDAVHDGGNRLLAFPLQEPRNYMPTTAPVSFPALWDTPYFDWVLYNASVREPMARNVSEALAVGMTPMVPRMILETMSERMIMEITAEAARSMVNMDELANVHKALQELQSPEWPEDILGTIDHDKAARGEDLYKHRCVVCHQLVDRRKHSPIDPPKHSANDPAPAAAPAGTDNCNKPTPGFAKIEIRTVPINGVNGVNGVGTDPNHAKNFAEREIWLPGKPKPYPYADLVRKLTKYIVQQWQDESQENQQSAEEINAVRPDDFRRCLFYRARPLNGIWATAPYLHNGSVPSLYDLLLPEDKRRRVFPMGNWNFDPEHVGLEISSGAFEFNTALPGNSNAGHTGHDYGTDLSEDQRMDLLEYLKKL